MTTIKHPSPAGRGAWGEGRWRLSVMLACLALLAACSGEPKTGPVEIKWDRDGCTHCGMALSDRHFAAQLRGGPKHRTFKFDDIGCLVEWLNKQPWADAPDNELWVMDYRSGQWLDARTAHYLGGKTSPMGYGYGAYAEKMENAIDFAELRKLVLAREHRHGGNLPAPQPTRQTP